MPFRASPLPLLDFRLPEPRQRLRQDRHPEPTFRHELVADYKAKYNVKPGIYCGEGFDAVNLIANAIKGAGAPGSDIKAYRAKVAANLASTSGFKGITKTYAFQPNGELVQSSVVIFLYKVVNDDYSTVGDVANLIK